MKILYSEKNLVIIKKDGLFLCYSYREIIGYMDKWGIEHFKDEELSITNRKHKKKFLKFVSDYGLTN